MDATLSDYGRLVLSVVGLISYGWVAIMRYRQIRHVVNGSILYARRLVFVDVILLIGASEIMVDTLHHLLAEPRGAGLFYVLALLLQGMFLAGGVVLAATWRHPAYRAMNEASE